MSSVTEIIDIASQQEAHDQIQEFRKSPERGTRRIPYTWDQKVEVATLFMQLGNMRLVSEKTGVNYQTILDWRKTDWWPSLCDEIKQIKRAKTSSKLETIVNDAIEVIQDRLVNGDFVLNNKTGEITRRPVSLRDAANMTNQMVTRQIQMEELAEKLTNRKDSVKETLALLNKEFAKLTREHLRNNAVDARIIENAVQVQEANEVDVSEETRNGEGMGVQDSESQNTPESR